MRADDEALGYVRTAIRCLNNAEGSPDADVVGNAIVRLVQSGGRAQLSPDVVEACAAVDFNAIGIGNIQLARLCSVLGNRRYPGYVAYDLVVDEGSVPGSISLITQCLDDAAKRDDILLDSWPTCRSHMPALEVRQSRARQLWDIAARCRKQGATNRSEYRRSIDWSLLPLSLSHDEGLFIRCFQVFECLFGCMAKLGEGDQTSDRSDPGELAAPLEALVNTFEICQGVWNTLRTIEWDSFYEFGRYSAAISAIESPSFRRFHASMEAMMRRTKITNCAPLAEQLGRIQRSYERWYLEHEAVVVALVQFRHPSATQIIRFFANSQYRRLRTE